LDIDFISVYVYILTCDFQFNDGERGGPVGGRGAPQRLKKKKKKKKSKKKKKKKIKGKTKKIKLRYFIFR
jgi:hypothetical protein